MNNNLLEVMSRWTHIAAVRMKLLTVVKTTALFFVTSGNAQTTPAVSELGKNFLSHPLPDYQEIAKKPTDKRSAILSLELFQLGLYKQWFTSGDETWSLLLVEIMKPQYGPGDVQAVREWKTRAARASVRGAAVTSLKVVERMPVRCPQIKDCMHAERVTVDVGFEFKNGVTQVIGDIRLTDVWFIASSGVVSWSPAILARLEPQILQAQGQSETRLLFQGPAPDVVLNVAGQRLMLGVREPDGTPKRR